ncbi:MAG: CocE/NonD family hydrolase [Hyphomonadaceae bacterium]|nr:CocE/NonD family hydrolase [Hyphomonadaceae bacterium]
MKRWVSLLVLLVAGCVSSSEGAPPLPGPSVASQYVEMADGTRIAVDIWRPSPEADELPTIMQFTRYWRALKPADGVSQDPGPEISFLLSQGYAVIVADARGTGASFGHRTTEFSDEELEDARQLIEWAAGQDWANGRVATLGASYLGNMAEMVAMTQPDGLVASVPRFSDFSEYRHAIRPGGIRNSVIADAWAAFTAALDANDPCGAFAAPGACPEGAPWRGGVKPVDGDASQALLDAAVVEHAGNTPVAQMLAGLRFAGDPFGTSEGQGVTLDDVSPQSRWPAIDAARIPALHVASWYDGGTAIGVLTRFMTYETPISVVIGPWSHGGGPMGRDVLGTTGNEATTSMASQYMQITEYLAPVMFGDSDTPGLDPVIRYYVLGANRWRQTNVWPPQDSTLQAWWLAVDGTLAAGEMPVDIGEIRFNVDPEASTGQANRWHTQLGVPVAYSQEDPKPDGQLEYESAPLQSSLELAGNPVADLLVSSSAPDAGLFVYLQAISPDGNIVHLSDGQLRLADRHVTSNATYHSFGVDHSFLRDDASPMKPGQAERVRVAMSPIAVQIPEDFSLRFLIRGADADTFEQVASEEVTLGLHNTEQLQPSISLPVVEED